MCELFPPLRICGRYALMKNALEARFIAELEALRPRAEFMNLFRAIVLDVWKKRLAQTGARQADFESRLGQLQRREAMLDDAYLYEKRVDSATYERQRDKLREDIALVRPKGCD